jgi:zinc transporter ZupT
VLLVNADKELSEGEAAAGLGTSLLAGFAIGLVVDVAVSYATAGSANEVTAAKDEEMSAVVSGNGTIDAIELKNAQMRTATSIFVGDFLHNMADGFFIGAAFKLCDNHMGWTVAMGAFAHELAQELADFFVLVGPGGMSIPKAVLLNVVSGMSVTLGGIIMTATDVGNTFTGYVLIFGAGAYFYIGCVEALRPRLSR